MTIRYETCKDCFCLFEYDYNGIGRPRLTCGDCMEKAREVKEQVFVVPCKVCQADIVYKSRRGKQPVYCDNCLDTDPMSIHQLQRASRPSTLNYPALAKARVDNLEMLLKSRGTHISQNLDKYQ